MSETGPDEPARGLRQVIADWRSRMEARSIEGRTSMRAAVAIAVREADGYRLRRINEAEGDAARFSALLTEYARAPEVTRRRIYMETPQEVLPKVHSKIVVDEQARIFCRC